MRRLSVLALLFAALAVSTLPASAAAEKDHFQAHLTAVSDTVPEGTNPQGQASFWFSEQEVGWVMQCTLTVAAVYDASSIRLQYRPADASEETVETVMYLFQMASGKYRAGRSSGLAIKDAFPPGTDFYAGPNLIGSSIASIEGLKEKMRAGEVYVSIFAGPDTETQDAVKILSGKVR